MSKSVKLLLGIVTLWPVFYMVLFMVMWAGMFVSFASTARTHHAGPPFGFEAFAVIAILHVSTMLIIFGLLVYYVVHLFKNDQVTQDKKALWAVVLILGNALAMPVYWYLYIWREPVGEASGTTL